MGSSRAMSVRSGASGSRPSETCMRIAEVCRALIKTGDADIKDLDRLSVVLTLRAARLEAIKGGKLRLVTRISDVLEMLDANLPGEAPGYKRPPPPETIELTLTPPEEKREGELSEQEIDDLLDKFGRGETISVASSTVEKMMEKAEKRGEATSSDLMAAQEHEDLLRRLRALKRHTLRAETIAARREALDGLISELEQRRAEVLRDREEALAEFERKCAEERANLVNEQERAEAAMRGQQPRATVDASRRRLLDLQMRRESLVKQKRYMEAAELDRVVERVKAEAKDAQERDEKHSEKDLAQRSRREGYERARRVQSEGHEARRKKIEADYAAVIANLGVRQAHLERRRAAYRG